MNDKLEKLQPLTIVDASDGTKILVNNLLNIIKDQERRISLLEKKEYASCLCMNCVVIG